MDDEKKKAAEKKRLRDICIRGGTLSQWYTVDGKPRSAKGMERETKKYRQSQYGRDYDTPEERDHEGNDVSDRDYWGFRSR